MLPNAIFDKIRLTKRIQYIIKPELRLAIFEAKRGLSRTDHDEYRGFRALLDALLQLDDALNTSSAVSQISGDVIPTIEHAYTLATQHARSASVIASARFSYIAQSLKWIESEILKFNS